MRKTARSASWASRISGRWWAGCIDTRGRSVGDLFHATFRAENGDHGVFEMRRVE
jgi:hypothetical protein